MEGHEELGGFIVLNSVRGRQALRSGGTAGHRQGQRGRDDDGRKQVARRRTRRRRRLRAPDFSPPTFIIDSILHSENLDNIMQ